MILRRIAPSVQRRRGKFGRYTLAYDKEPEYTKEELAAGISYTSGKNREEVAASLETKCFAGNERPSAARMPSREYQLVRVRRWPIAWTVFAVRRLK